MTELAALSVLLMEGNLSNGRQPQFFPGACRESLLVYLKESDRGIPSARHTRQLA
jgi:hypothetical protein